MNKLMWKALEAGVGLKAHLLSLRNEKGQGTTEYAILVGVLVVIAILAIIAFRGKVQELWTAIVNGMNAL
jgi:Flp pilus assembly pilin Flp